MYDWFSVKDGKMIGVRWLSAIQGNKGKQNKAGKERVISVLTD